MEEDTIMEEPTDREVPSMPTRDQPDPAYARITAEGLQEEASRQAEAEAEAERQRASAPPPFPPEKKAENLRNYAGATFMFGATAGLFGTVFDIETQKVYLDRFLADAGAPTDPVERMLLEQLALSHFTLGRLHFRAGSRENADEITACLATAARLQGEFRKTALALETYRQSLGMRQARESKAKAQPRRKPATAAVNARGSNGATTSPDSELVSNASANRLNGYMNGTCHAHPVHS